MPRAVSPARRSELPVLSAAMSARTRDAGITAQVWTVIARVAIPAMQIRRKEMNREHCLYGANRCVAVTPSDTAPALLALDASMHVQNADGKRVVAAEDFFIGPDVDIERMTVLEPGDVLTAITIPRTWSGATFYFEKVADRNTWDFALVNIAAAMHLNGNTISDIRIACGGVECVPRRLNVVEDIVKGGKKDDESAMIAGNAASRGATPLNYNHFKIPLMENLVTRAIRDA